MFPLLPVGSQKNTLLSSHGRAPWYGEDGRPIHDAFVIGIAGGSASGKTYVAQQIIRALEFLPTIVILSQDSFYKNHTPEELKQAFANDYDFDHPSAIDMDMFAQCLKDLKEHRQTNIPVYSFVQHQRLPQMKYLYGAAVIIVEGILALQDPALRKLYDLKMFVQCDSDLMLARRLKRDMKERGRTAEDVLEQYLRFVKPSYDNFVYPSSQFADIIIPAAQNQVAVDLVVNHIRNKLVEQSAAFRGELSRVSHNLPLEGPHGLPAWGGVVLLRQTTQLRGIHTILRDCTTSREDFIFYADRLATLVVEHGMTLLPYAKQSVHTPVGVTAEGLKLKAKVCGVSIIRAGGPLEKGLQRVVRDISLGALLIQSHPKTGEPLLLYSDLPRCVRRRETSVETFVFLLDTQIGTGAAALMAIRVLLDHGVREDHIIFLTFLISQKGGPNVIQRAFPAVRIVTSAVDGQLKELWGTVECIEQPGEGRKVWVITPGMGHIGNRYYL